MDMQQDQGMMQDQSQDQGQGDGGYCIEIYVGPGNRVMSIEVEPKSQDDQDETGEENSGTEVHDIKQALDMAMQIYQSGGQMDATQGQDRESIARKVFGDDIVDNQAPGELNRKQPRGGYL